MLRQWWPEKLEPWDHVGPCNFLVLCHDSSCTLLWPPLLQVGVGGYWFISYESFNGRQWHGFKAWTCQVGAPVKCPNSSGCRELHAIQASGRQPLRSADRHRSSAPRNLKCWGQMCCADGRPGHRDADILWLCCKICKALSFSFEEHQVLEGEGSGLPPEGHWNVMECSWFMGSSLVIRKLNHRYHRHFWQSNQSQARATAFLLKRAQLLLWLCR